MMLLLFGFALSLDVDRIPTLIYDQDGTAASRDLIRQFQGSRYLRHPRLRERLRARSSAASTAASMLMGVVIPRDYSRRRWRAGARRRCRFCWTAAIPTRPRSRWATPRALVRSYSLRAALRRA